MPRNLAWTLCGLAGAVVVGSVLRAAQVDLPPAEERDVVQRMCGTGCHTIDIVIKHRMNAGRWADVVDNMVVRGAQGTPEEAGLVTRYLARHFGVPESLERAAREEVPDRDSASSADAFAPAAAVDVAARGRGSVETGWPSYGHDPGGQRFSPLTEITPENVGSLQRAWARTFTPATVPGPPGAARRGRVSQMTPLVVNDMMYLTTVSNHVMALEPETGRTIWESDIESGLGIPALRGLAYWPGDGEAPPTLFFGTSAGALLAVSARTGQPVRSFGRLGVVDLRVGLTETFPQANYGMSSPPVIYKHLVITGSRVQEQPYLGPPGDIRAWDARTGALVWRFHTVPRPGEIGHDTWEGDAWKDRSGANAWGPMTVDVDRGLVFLPLGSVTYDYYGGDRKGANLFGSTLVALDALTGAHRWHFQTTHHDIWDYDLPSPPALMDVVRDGVSIPAVAQMTKQGLLFILNRETGEPIHGVEERATPQDGFWPGEHPWPTQPFPVKPVPLARNSFNPSELASITPEHRALCEDLLRKDGGLRTGGPYLPFGVRPSLLFPGTLGGGNWHGTSYNPELGYLFVNTQNLGEVYQIQESAEHGPLAHRWKFWDEHKFWPCQEPPWGELSAVNVNTGDVAWRVPLGRFEELEALGHGNTGTPNMGGSIATAGGVLFIGGTVDNTFRAFDARTGRELWATDVGASARAVPITFEGRDGRQYVAVMVSGGGFLGDPTIPATLNVFALP